MVLFSLVALLAAVGINSALVLMHRKQRIPQYTEQKHALLITPPWLVFVASLVAVALYPSYVYEAGIASMLFGALIAVVSFGLFVYVVRILGSGSLVNRNIFQKQPMSHHRIFSIHANPMYVSYSLGIAALGLLLGIYDFYVVSAASYVLLNYVEAKVEQP